MSAHCSMSLLESALQGDLPADDESSLERHLEGCAECSAALERMAGGPAFCREAATLLAGDELDASAPARDEWSDVDFTVEHLEPADEPSVLGRLGGYDVLEIIGHGGMGVVLKGFDRELKRSIAIKVLAPHLARSSLAKKRFAREAQAAAAVVHPHVLAIHQVQPNGRLPFLVMPLVAGESLAERLAARGALELKEVLRIGMQAAAGLAAAHEQGLVHRDVKPANILLEKGVERAVLTDFGLARAADDVALTRWGIIAGTPEYMSPEQARGEPLDGRSDLFSLGCVLYEMATGVSPFRADGVMATMRRLVDDPPRALASLNPELPPWFVAIVDRLLQKDPSRRFGCAREVSELLEGCLAHVQQPAAVPLPASLLPHAAGGRSILASHRQKMTALLGIAGVALLGLVLWQTSKMPDGDGSETGQAGGQKAGDREPGGTGRPTSATFHSDLSALTGQLQRREESIRQISYQGTVRYLEKLDTVREEGESNEAFIQRYTSLPPTFSNVAPFSLAVVRDYSAGIGHVKLGDIDQSVPKYMEYFFRGETVTQLMGVEPGRCQATISKTRPPELSEPSETMPRMDILAIRPVRDNPLHSTIAKAATTMGLPDAGGRPLFQLARRPASESASGWVATFMHQEPRGAGGERKQILWYRLYLDAVEGELVVARVDELSTVGDSDSMPVTVTLLEEYREVENVRLPHRIRMFRFGNTFLLGSELTITDVKVNDAVKVPAGLQIPAGTSVRDMISGRQYRAAASSQPDATGKVPEPEWGEREGGVRIRASTAKRQWRTDEQVELTVDLNNESGGRLAMARIPYCEVEIDGAWYVPALTERPVAGSYVVGPGIHARVGVIRLARNEWVLKSAVKGDIRTDARAFHRELLLASADPANQLRLAPGKHTCRVACEINGLAGDDAKRIGQPVSQPVEIEIASADSEPGRQPGESRPDTTHITPTRLNYFTTGHGIKVACSADGKLIAVANGNPTRILQVSGTSRVKGDWKPSADILDSETGKTVISLELTTADEDAVLAATDRISHVEVTAFAFSPAEDLIAVGTSVGQVKLFDARTGELVRSLDDEQPRLADPDTPEHWAPLQRGMGSVASIAFSPDGSLLAVCGSTFREFSDIFDGIQRLGRATTGPGRLKVWEVNTGKLKHDLAGHSHADAVSFSAGGELLASAGRWTSEADNGTGVIIWDAQTGAKMRTIPTGANGGTYAVVFSPTSKLMAIGSRHFDKENDTSTTTVSLADASSGITEWEHTVPGGANPKAFSRDGTSVLVLCGRSIQILDAATGTVKREIQADDLSRDGRWNDLAVAPRGSLLVIGAVDEEEGSVEVLDLAAPGAESGSGSQPKAGNAMPERIRDFQTSEPVDAIACSADGTLVAVASAPADWPRTVEVLDAETGKPVIALSLTTKDEEAALAAAEGRPHFPVGPLAFSPDGNVLAVGTGLGQVKLFHARTGELLRALDDEQAKLAENESPETLKLLPRAMGSVASLAFSLDGSLLAVCGSSFEDAALRWGHIERGGLREFAVGPGRLKVWDVNAGTLKLDLVGHSQVRMVSFSADGTLLASAGTDITGAGSVIVWDPRTGEKLRTLQQQANAGTHAVAFSPVNKLVVIGSRVYDKEDDTSTTNVTLTYPLSGITEWQRTVPGWANPKAFWPDGSSVVVQCGGESVRLIETGTGGDKHTFKSTDAPPGGRWNGFAIAPQGHRLFVGGTGADGRGFVAVWAWEGASGDER